MKKIWILLIIFLIVGGSAAWLLRDNEKDEKTSLLGEDRKFAVKDIAQVHKIFMADHKNHRTTLEKKGDHWIYNGKYEARPNAIENLLSAIEKIEVKYQPPTAAVKNMIKTLATEGIKVEIYNKKNELIKSYYVGGATMDERGTHVIMAGAEQPYVAYIPSWSGNIRFRYNLKGDDWRQRIVFDANVENIEVLEVEYPKQRNKSYRIKKGASAFEIEPFYDITPRQNGDISSGKFEQYLSHFENLSSKGFDNYNIEKDSISASIPFCKISLKTTGGEETQLELFPIFPKPVYDEKLDSIVPGLGGVSNYYALLNEEDFIVVSQLVFKKVLWSYESFFE